MRRLRARLLATLTVATTIVVACSYSPSPGTAGDAQVDDDAPPILPDAGCAGASVACFSDGNGGTVLQTCTQAGADPVNTPCNLGCIADGSAEPHCGVLEPSGGAVMPVDTLPKQDQTLADVDFDLEDITVNSDTGEISGGIRPAGPETQNGIEFISRNNVGIFRFNTLTISEESVRIRGLNGVAFVALDSIFVNEEIDLRDCSNAMRAQGGFLGGAPSGDGGEPTEGKGGEGGEGNNDDSSGGGGGGHAGSGGQGGGGNNEGRTDGGTTFGDELITILRGGAGGGGGGNNGGRGGNGGGAIQLVANNAIVFNAAGRINAGGCGGQAGQNGRAAGGGGAGGAILLEAKTIATASGAAIVVNGGGGGGGDDQSTNGGNGGFSLTRATGGNGGGSGGSGGRGGAGETAGGENGDSDRNGGGGGGGVGWIRVNTLAGEAAIDPGTIFSPPMLPMLSTTQGTVVVK